MSLGSNPEVDDRFSTAYTQLGVYRGRVVAVKPISKRAVDITRKVKKELKLVSIISSLVAFNFFYYDVHFIRNILLLTLWYTYRQRSIDISNYNAVYEFLII